MGKSKNRFKKEGEANSTGQMDISTCREGTSQFVTGEQLNLSETGNSYKESRDDNRDDLREEVLRTEQLTRDERDRRTQLTEARKRRLRDFERHPLESWESSLSDLEQSALAAQGNKKSNDITSLGVARGIALRKGVQ